MNTAIVTGASGNLGQAVVKKFIAEGYKVIGTVIPNDPVLCKNLLAREGLYVIEADVLVVIVKDLPGELARISEALAQAAINIDYVYGTQDSSEREMRLVFKVSHLAPARAAVEAIQ